MDRGYSLRPGIRWDCHWHTGTGYWVLLQRLGVGPRTGMNLATWGLLAGCSSVYRLVGCVCGRRYLWANEGTRIGQGGGRGMRHLAESQAGTVEGGGGCDCQLVENGLGIDRHMHLDEATTLMLAGPELGHS